MSENAVKTVEPEQPTATAIIQVIERAASNPQVDIDKMERLLQMQERILDRNAKAAYTAALAELQTKLPVITERGEIKVNNKVQSRYALWEDVNDTIKPLLAEYGFALSFRIGKDGNDITVTGVLSHRDGHSEETTISLPADTSGSKNAVQARASSISYGKRYTAFALLNITSRGEDDDGRKAGGPETISEQQCAEIEALIKEVGADRARFLKWAKVETLDQIPAKNYRAVVKQLEAKRRS